MIVTFLIGIIAMLIGLLPSPLDDPQYFRYPSPPYLEGVLALNTKLQKAKRLYENQVYAPESFTSDPEGHLYTGLGDGRIVQFHVSSNGDLTDMTLITRTGEDHPYCGKAELEHICGRPNAVRFASDGSLYVADAYKGLLKVQVPLGVTDVLIPAETGINGVPFKFLNGLEISKSGLIYFTESSSKWDRRNNRYEILELNNLGRLMVYDPKTKQAKTLLTGIYFANGIALSPDESFIVINELSTCRISIYYLSGPNAGKSDVWAENLPGFPDNIRLNSRGNFYVGMSYTRYANNILSQFMDYTGPFPSLRKFIAKILPLHWYDIFLPKHSIIVELDMDGKMVSSLQDPTAYKIATVTDVFEYNENIYIGSFEAPFIGKLSLSDAHTI